MNQVETSLKRRSRIARGKKQCNETNNKQPKYEHHIGCTQSGETNNTTSFNTLRTTGGKETEQNTRLTHDLNTARP